MLDGCMLVDGGDCAQVTKLADYAFTTRSSPDLDLFWVVVVAVIGRLTKMNVHSENPRSVYKSPSTLLAVIFFALSELLLGMGKKSNESSVDTAEAINYLFSVDNPFRRKPQSDAAVAFPGVIPPPPTKPGFTADKAQGVEGEAVRKRKRDIGIKPAASSPPSEGEEPIPRKRKKFRKAADSVTVDTNESFDDESKLLRTVFVGNLPLKTKRKALNREFSRFGEIESVRIRSVPLVDSKAPRKAAIIMGQINEEIDSVNAYIVFKEEQSAQSALSQNMAQVGGNHIRVDMACPPRKKMKGESRVYDRKKTAFVGNLPFDVKDEELYKLFCGLNPSEPNVEAVRVIRDPSTSAGKGIAYVLFKTRDAANQVCRRRDLKIRDRNLRVCHVKSDVVPSNKVKVAPTRSFPSRSPASGSGATPSGRGENWKRKVSASVSYEGTRSSKKGAMNKTGTRSSKKGAMNKTFSQRFPKGKSNSGFSSSSWSERKAHVKKRPAVAARKDKQLKKRKQADFTPENTRRNKKARKL
ncbi:hypothetical protein KSP40_PGU006959 [Platanthera guangdongensis]|uniref:RRM domain-containing protein n=1 Tax=Platanthera guangdongensis TaxID=2320717 RepID=A0ABR2LM71_9ASPA